MAKNHSVGLARRHQERVRVPPPFERRLCRRQKGVSGTPGAPDVGRSGGFAAAISHVPGGDTLVWRKIAELRGDFQSNPILGEVSEGAVEAPSEGTNVVNPSLMGRWRWLAA
jgi:hypothetical protein